MSKSMRENEDSLFAQYIAQAVFEYLRHISPKEIKGDEIYKFSVKVWFDFEDGKVKSLTAIEPTFVTLNKSLNKKYRKAANANVMPKEEQIKDDNKFNEIAKAQEMFRKFGATKDCTGSIEGQKFKVDDKGNITLPA